MQEMKEGEQDKDVKEENNQGIEINSGVLIIPILMKIRISKMIRFIALLSIIFGTARFVDVGSPIYAVWITTLLEISAIILY